MPISVVHCKRDKYDVYIGRGKNSVWGNPFIEGKDGDRDEVIVKYRNWIQTRPDLLAKLPSLKGKSLGCWCWPKACHGEVLAELAGEPVKRPEPRPRQQASPRPIPIRNQPASVPARHLEPRPQEAFEVSEQQLQRRRAALLMVAIQVSSQKQASRLLLVQMLSRLQASGLDLGYAFWDLYGNPSSVLLSEDIAQAGCQRWLRVTAGWQPKVSVSADGRKALMSLPAELRREVARYVPLVRKSVF